MPYLQVDLDGRRKWPQVAAGLKIHKAFVAEGFLDLWETCWRERTDKVTVLRLELMFEGATGERVAQVLCALDFLEELPDASYRVRGADKYLRIIESRSEGGKKASGNLRRGKSPGSSRKPAGKQPGDSPGSTPALTPITEHQSPNTEHEKLAGKQRPPDPRHAPLVKALTEAAPGYVFDKGQDAKQVTLLLAKGSPEEVLIRWRRALARTGYPLVRTLTELVRNWNHFSTDEPTGAAGRRVDVSRGMVRAQDIQADAFKKTGTVDDF